MVELELQTSKDSVAVPYTTTDCPHCGKFMEEQDSYVVDEDGNTKSCIHWHLKEEL